MSDFLSIPVPSRTVLRGGTVVDGGGSVPRMSDVVLVDGLIQSIGQAEKLPGDKVIDCAGRLVMPGFVDAHSHGDAVVFEADVQLSLLRQGITTVIGGQDGVSYAPGSGAYASSYFAAINGAHPTYAGGGVAELLTCHDGQTPLNFAYLVPAGTVRWEVMGRSTESPSAEQLRQMRTMVQQGLAEGAVGLSSGLDYVPGIFASTAELAELCIPVAAADSVYVTHMRGGYEANSREGVEEIMAISATSGVKTHISHFHASAPIVESMLEELAQHGVDATFDAYPYTRGCSLLSMPMLPPELSIQPVDDILAVLGDPRQRAALVQDWFPEISEKASFGPEWPTMITLAHVASPDYAWTLGLNLAQAAAQAEMQVEDLVLDLLLSSRLEVNVVMAVRHDRDMAELSEIMASPLHLAGSDGIFIGAHPHPRAAGSFPKYLRSFVREDNSWTWPKAVRHLSTGSCERFGLGLRGRIAPGWIADLVILDPETVADTASYESPAQLAVGIDDVFVDGVQVLAHGALTGAMAGRAIRKGPAVH